MRRALAVNRQLTFFYLFWVLAGPAQASEEPANLEAFQQRIREAAEHLLASEDISYIYGGNAVGSPRVCRECSECLGREKPKPKQRLVSCPICEQCGIDCSHFTQRVYEDAGMPYPYLETKAMLGLPPPVLQRRYGLTALDPDVARAVPGDLLVYEGHVVLLESSVKGGRGDIIHATSGRDLKGPGMGIQRQRQADLARFRGPLLRILRHAAYYRVVARSSGRLRPVGKSR